MVKCLAVAWFICFFLLAELCICTVYQPPLVERLVIYFLALASVILLIGLMPENEYGPSFSNQRLGSLYKNDTLAQPSKSTESLFNNLYTPNSSPHFLFQSEERIRFLNHLVGQGRLDIGGTIQNEGIKLVPSGLNPASFALCSLRFRSAVGLD